MLLLDRFLGSAWMQGVANELQQAETAFLAPDESGDYQLRWFTPVAEVALCGHATLASAHWLWETGILPEDAVASFITLSGRLTAERRDDSIVLDFPAVPAHQLAPPPRTRSRPRRHGSVWTGVTDDPDPGERNLLAVLDSEQAVRDLVPDLQAITRMPVGGLIVTARSHQPGGVVSRYFAPVYGISEDPVTGSAHCTRPILARRTRHTVVCRAGVCARRGTDRHHDRRRAGPARGEGAHSGHRVHPLTVTEETPFTCCNPAEQHMKPCVSACQETRSRRSLSACRRP